MLSGTLLYLIPPGRVRVGRPPRPGTPSKKVDVVLDGPLIKQLHWLVREGVVDAGDSFGMIIFFRSIFPIFVAFYYTICHLVDVDCVRFGVEKKLFFCFLRTRGDGGGRMVFVFGLL